MSATVGVSSAPGRDQLAGQLDWNLDDVQRTPVVSVHLVQHVEMASINVLSEMNGSDGNDGGHWQSTDGDV